MHNWNFSACSSDRSQAATATSVPPVPPVTGPAVTAVLLEDGCFQAICAWKNGEMIFLNII